MALSDQTTDLAAISKWGKLVPAHYDYVGVVQTSTVIETFTFRQGGASGKVVATVVVTYAASDHDVLVSVERT